MYFFFLGTLRPDRKGVPKSLVKKKLKKGQISWARDDSTTVCKWKDKRDVLTITNKHKVEMVRAINKRGQEKIKPNIVVDYNNHMSGIDHSDQMLSYYSCLRKTTRWYKKIACHILEQMLFNAYKLHSKTSMRKMREIQFRNIVIRLLVGPMNDPSLKVVPEKFHYLECIPANGTKQNPTRKCVVCSKNSLRKESRYECPKCDPKVALCVTPCFKVYHEQNHCDIDCS
jgi:hypothetical protein